LRGVTLTTNNQEQMTKYIIVELATGMVVFKNSDAGIVKNKLKKFIIVYGNGKYATYTAIELTITL
jgi:hypothetical protein